MNITDQSLRRWNVIAGFAHLIQLILILVLANDFTLPVTATYMEGPPGTPPSDTVSSANMILTGQVLTLTSSA